MEFHDQRQSNGAGESGDQGRGQAQESTGQMMGSLEDKAHEGGDPIYDAIREAKEERAGQMMSSLENKGQIGGDPVNDAIQEAKEAMKQKAQKEKTGEHMNPMYQTNKGVYRSRETAVVENIGIFWTLIIFPNFFLYGVAA